MKIQMVHMDDMENAAEDLRKGGEPAVTPWSKGIRFTPLLTDTHNTHSYSIKLHSANPPNPSHKVMWLVK